MAGSLLRHRDFLLLWVGQSVSQFGNQFTGLALPFLAVYVLGADAAQMGLLGAAGTLPFLLFGLLVGVWVDRHRRRPILIVGDAGRGVLVGAIALMAFAGVLQLWYLYFFALGIGTLQVFFDVTYQAYLPSLVDRDRLVDANSKLETSNSLAQVAGPTLAGIVIQIFTAPAAMVFDAFTFLLSTGTLASIRKDEPRADPKDHPSVAADVREGLAVVLRDPRLRSIALSTSTSNFFSGWAFVALFFLFVKADLGFDAFGLGITFGLAAVGGLVGALVARPIADRSGVGWAIILGALLGGGFMLPIPFASGPFAVAIVTASLAGSLFGVLVYNINQVSFRQAAVPLRLQGRLNATMRTIVWGTLPLGSLAGGAAGTALGVRAAFTLGVLGGLTPFLWVLFSPVRTIVTMPNPAD